MRLPARAEQILAAPAGVITRAALRHAMPYLGRERFTSGHRARRYAAGGTAGASRGRRSTAAVRKILADMEADGIVRRDGDVVVLVDRAALTGWLDEATADEG